MTFVSQLNEELLPYVRSLPTYAGAWIDQTANGSLVVMLTVRDAALQKTIAAMAPLGGRAVRFEIAPNSDHDIAAALDKLVASWPTAAPNIALVEAGVDTIGNGLLVTVAASEVRVAEAAVRSIGLPASIHVAVQAGSPAVDVCSPARICSLPVKAGIVVENSYAGSGRTCTMAWHIALANGDKQWMTAGHCGRAYLPPHVNPSTRWYHQGYGYLGDNQSNLEDLPSTKKDEMRIQMPDALATPAIYGQGGSTIAAALPVVGEALCASKGISDAIQCGTVTTTWTSWTSTDCNPACTVYGAGMSGISAIPGDSGSPLYQVINQGGGQRYIVPVGVLDTAGGLFARVSDALSYWGATIVQ